MKTKQNPNKKTFKKLRTCSLCLCLYRTRLLQSWTFLSWWPGNGSMYRDYLLRISEYPHAPCAICTSLIVTTCDIPSLESSQGKYSSHKFRLPTNASSAKSPNSFRTNGYRRPQRTRASKQQRQVQEHVRIPWPWRNSCNWTLAWGIFSASRDKTSIFYVPPAWG